jgi:deoxycytidylate deaminase
MKMIIAAGIRKITYEEGYPDRLAEEMMKESSLELFRLTKEQV